MPTPAAADPIGGLIVTMSEISFRVNSVWPTTIIRAARASKEAVELPMSRQYPQRVENG